jgi:hypothetical protein
MTQTELSAGPNQKIVVYVSDDTGVEIDPAGLYGAIAQDAEARAASGWRIVSTAAVSVPGHSSGAMAADTRRKSRSRSSTPQRSLWPYPTISSSSS